MYYLLEEKNEELTVIGTCEDNCDYITALGREVKKGEELWFVKASSKEEAIEWCFELGTYIADLSYDN